LANAPDMPARTSRKAANPRREPLFATPVKARIFRDFLGPSGSSSAAMNFPNFHKPLHFKEKYDFIERIFNKEEHFHEPTPA